MTGCGLLELFVACFRGILIPIPSHRPDTAETSVRSTYSNLKGRRMTDPTEDIRKQMLAEINAAPGSREYLEAQARASLEHSELSDDFEVIGFTAPLVVVRRKSDGQKGSLMFQASPRFYFSFEPHRP